MVAAIAAFFLCITLPATEGCSSEPVSADIPTGEKWFAILIDNEQVGFYRQVTTLLPDGDYLIEGDGSDRIKVMGFTKESSYKKVYRTGSDLTLKSLEVEQIINGKVSRLKGKLIPGGLQVKHESDGKKMTRLFKLKGKIYPEPALNMLPALRHLPKGESLDVTFFDTEDFKSKGVRFIAEGVEQDANGQTMLKLSNNLHPFVSNEIWIDLQGNTLLESVREGLVITKTETAEKLSGFVTGTVMSQKDLIYDLSQIKLPTPLHQPLQSLTGLAVRIDGYGTAIPVLSDGWQQVERNQESLVIRNGSLKAAIGQKSGYLPSHLEATELIESDSPVIKSKAAEITSGADNDQKKSALLISWVFGFLKDDIDDSGTAVTTMKAKKGNCQSHARLYTALARGVGIPTRFVSGLVSKDGAGFLYHSWAESWLNGGWVPVDPTFNQPVADFTHIPLLEGDAPEELAPLVGLVGKIKLTVLEQAP